MLSLVGIVRTPTGFLPTEDQGYVMIAVQLPNAAALGRSQVAMASSGRCHSQGPGVAETIVIGGSGSSPIDSSASLFNSGVIYAVLKPSKERGRAEDLEADEQKHDQGGRHRAGSELPRSCSPRRFRDSDYPTAFKCKSN